MPQFKYLEQLNCSIVYNDNEKDIERAEIEEELKAELDLKGEY